MWAVPIERSTSPGEYAGWPIHRSNHRNVWGPQNSPTQAISTEARRLIRGCYEALRSSGRPSPGHLLVGNNLEPGDDKRVSRK